MTRLHSISPILISLVLAMTACGSGAKATRPALPATSATFSTSGDAAVADRYWTAFGDRTLDAMVDEALANNPGLLATWSRIAQAEAASRAAGATRYPTLSASGSVSGSGNSTDGTDLTGSTGRGIGLSASYEVDLWGKLSAAREASALAAQASVSDLRASSITLSATVASTWFDIVIARQDLALLDQQLADEVEAERLINLRYEAGQIPQTDAIRQQQQVESIRGDRELASARIAVLEHQLAILRGLEPTASSPASDALPVLPPLPATGVPGEVLGRRPDVMSRLVDIEIADRRVAIAVADKFPSLKLSASMSASGNVYELVTSFASSLVASITAPLLDGGRLDAEEDRAREVVIEKVYVYRETLLSAMREVEDALIREDRQVRYIESLGVQLELAVKVRAGVEAAYAAGTADALDRLAAGESQRSLERRLLAAHRTLLDYRLALYRALAGGWDMTRPPLQTPKKENDNA